MFGANFDRDRIWVYDKLTDAIALRSTRDTAVIGNYYTLRSAEGPSDELETVLSDLEAAAAPALRQLAGERPFPLAMDRRAALAGYLGVQYTRVPRHRNEMEEMQEFMAGAMLDVDLSHQEGWPDRARKSGMSGTDEELERERLAMLASLRSGEMRLRAATEASLSAIPMGLEFAPILAEMNWMILRRRSSPYFLIGDSPVTLWGSPDRPRHQGVGFLSNDAEVAFPVDPMTTLVMRWDGRDALEWDHEWLERRNGLRGSGFTYQYRQWRMAERFVYAQRRTDLEFVQMALEPDMRRAGPGGLQVANIPDEWRSYLRPSDRR